MTVIAGSMAAGRLGAVTVAERSHLIHKHKAEREGGSRQTDSQTGMHRRMNNWMLDGWTQWWVDR